ncbi:glycogen synthase GlgA [Thermochromatium tepidum]|uniref:Glycogen synthase n=1 Tax=Thermochromatium tepidum ATCC 43061 TaxID=316276 RepID=A0A6I6EET6_THETI|nr:glycogen synthase GlgA [Thermochromatium tepidum]QGU31877.1 glycogen synthase GlgA [Thermochromatium tepidum ATCC 43061]
MESSLSPLDFPAFEPKCLRILVASSEAHPLIKTGGLADVAASLPAALRQLGHDARLVIPGYPLALRQLREPKPLGEIRLQGYRSAIRLIEGRHPDHDLPVYLVDAPEYFAREGNPYCDPTGRDWGDNPDRFMLFCRVLALMAQGLSALGWRPDVFHGNDWQTGPAPTLLQDAPWSPARVFTIHNLAYQGLFDRATFDRLELPSALWNLAGLEFHQRLSFIKGGIVFSERVNTVSPTYAEEVRTVRFGCGLDGLLRQIGHRFSGILNGIDYQVWNPAADPLIFQNYDAERFGLKTENKLDIQRELGLPRSEDAFVLGYIGRLVEQKGVDLIQAILPELLQDPRVQIMILAAGERRSEQALLELAGANPRQIGVHIGYDEARAHRIEAGCDAFLMPSRFEPCGLNQIYSLRYGTPPIVHRTGGLVDTVVPATAENLAKGTATGFVFDEPTPRALLGAVRWAMQIYRDDPEGWRRLAITGMAQDFSWESSARRYIDLYHEAIADRMALERVRSA